MSRFVKTCCGSCLERVFANKMLAVGILDESRFKFCKNGWIQNGWFKKRLALKNGWLGCRPVPLLSPPPAAAVPAPIDAC
eukprot:COSAG06_NODE_253_length_19061_cov_33.083114_7_plen_80_part_00